MTKIKNEPTKELFANNHPISQHVSLRDTHNHIHPACRTKMSEERKSLGSEVAGEGRERKRNETGKK